MRRRDILLCARAGCRHLNTYLSKKAKVTAVEKTADGWSMTREFEFLKFKCALGDGECAPLVWEDTDLDAIGFEKDEFEERSVPVGCPVVTEQVVSGDAL